MPTSPLPSPSTRSSATLASVTIMMVLLAAKRVRATVERRTAVDAGDRSRGDVPGWVLVTVMTAGMVIALWAVAQPALSAMFSSALASVKGPGAGG